MEWKCLICNKPVPNYVPEFCCYGIDCNCMGQPLNPCVCSNECEKAIFDFIGLNFEDRAKRANIKRFDS